MSRGSQTVPAASPEQVLGPCSRGSSRRALLLLVACSLGAALWAAAPAAAGPRLPSTLATAAAFTPVMSGASTRLQAAALAVQQGALTAPEAGTQDELGTAVAISGDTAIVGAPGRVAGGMTGAGSAFVFVRVAGVWTFQQELVSPAPAADDQFGVAVAISGDTALVGDAEFTQPGHPYPGAVHVFTRSAGVWTLAQTLMSGDPTSDDSYGTAVAIEGDSALVGAMSHGPAGMAPGCVYAYTCTAGMWGSEQKLEGSDVLNGDGFGISVALDGDTAVVGAWRHNHNGAGLQSGSAFVFTLSGGVWAPQQELTGTYVSTSDTFGRSVAISGDTVLVGARNHNYAGLLTGAAYVFVRDGGEWTQQAQLVPADGSSYDYFGTSVAVAADRALVGATAHGHTATTHCGVAYCFTRDEGVWSEREEFTGADSLQGDRFGTAVALSQDTALVGAPNRAVAGHGAAGAAFTFLIGHTVPVADVTPPVTTVTGLRAGWGRTPLTITLAARDDFPGAITTQYRLQGATEWQTYTAPFAAGAQGTSVYEYYSTDAALNPEAMRTFQVRVDRLGPQTLALAKVAVTRGRKATFKFRVNDATESAKASIRIFKGTSLKKTIAVGSVATNASRSFKWTCKLAAGVYTWKIYATDLAGNAQRSVGYKTLRVK